MGRHSRKKRPDSGGPPDTAARRGERSPSPSQSPPRAQERPRPQAPSPAGPETDEAGQAAEHGGGRGPATETAVSGSEGPEVPGVRTPDDAYGTHPPRESHGPHAAGSGVRGGHPEQREPGGGWGADGAGTGPPGPRQEYLDAFDDDVFRAGAPGTDATGPSEDFGDPAGRRGGIAPPRTGDTPAGHGQVPSARTGGSGGGPSEDPPGGPSGDPPARRAARAVRRPGAGRALTGAAAAAVTTVLAVVIAGQAASSGGAHSGGRGPDGKGAHRAADDGTASRSGGRRAAGHPESAAAVYRARMAKPYPLAVDFKADGDFRTVPGHKKGPGRGKVLRYRVDVEKGLPLNGKLFAEAVHKTLNDDRSWAHGGKRSFDQVDHGRADFRITLASSPTTDTWCAKSGLDTSEEHVSCDSAATDRVMINGYRWARGAPTYGHKRMHMYRQMLVNHEVGHRLGHDHVGCHKKGALAPVMMQQTKYLTTHGVTCRPNAWPHPRR